MWLLLVAVISGTRDEQPSERELGEGRLSLGLRHVGMGHGFYCALQCGGIVWHQELALVVLLW